MGKIIDFIKSNIRIIILVIIIGGFFIYFFSKESLKTKTTYTVVEGTIEKSQETNMYVLKKESLVEYDNSQPVISIVEQGKRAAKSEAIATYKNESYDDYLKQIEEIDKQIQTLVKDLPNTYSADISNIEDKILKYATDIQKSTSYIKMQEYKTKLDELAYKKISILANSSPDSSAIRDLVNKREELVKMSKNSSNIIYTPISGLVTYKVDGLENVYNYNDVQGYDISKINEIISSLDKEPSSQFGIKVIDNYGAYLLVKTERSENDEYIKQGYNYKIRISDIENSTITAYLVKNLQDEKYNYSIFMIENEIDNLVDYRKLSCKVIWKTNTGMAVPVNAIYEENGYKYVLVVYGTEYIKIPVKVTANSDSIAIVKNYSKEELKELNLDIEFELELYDELVIQ